MSDLARNARNTLQLVECESPNAQRKVNGVPTTTPDIIGVGGAKDNRPLSVAVTGFNLNPQTNFKDGRPTTMMGVLPREQPKKKERGEKMKLSIMT